MGHRYRFISIALLVNIIIFMIIVKESSASYKIIDLGVLSGGANSYALDINNSGQVVGYSGTANGWHATLWSNGNAIDLSGINSQSEARSINDDGKIVGINTIFTNGPTTSAVLWTNGTMIDLGSFGGIDSESFGINNLGQVVGSSNYRVTDYSYPNSAFVYANGSMKKLGINGYASVAYSINDLGIAVGQLNGVAVVFDTITNSVEYLGSGVAIRINNFGQILVNNSLLSSDKITYFDKGVATDINNVGQVVGYDDKSGLYDRAIIYNNGISTYLDSLIYPNSGWALREAFAINDSGQIVGDGLINGQVHAFLLSPDMQPIPEPTTILLFLCGLSCIVVMKSLWG